MSDYSELEMLAEKATPGPWWIDSHGMTMMSMESLKVVFNHPAQSVAVRNEETGNLSHWNNDWDASFIASANPLVIKTMIDEIKQLKAELECARGDLKTAGEVIERYKKDAERYRFIRDNNWLITEEFELCDKNDGGLDATIDAAIAKEIQ